MKQLKRLTSVLLVLGIVLGLMPLSAFAAEPENAVATTFTVTEQVTGGKNTYTYTLLDDNTVELTGFDTTATVAYVEIPSTATSDGKKYSVTSIGTSAFTYHEELNTVTLPDSIVSIGTGAFGFCFQLTTVNFGNSVVSIGDSAFAYTSLKSVTLPDSIVSIGAGAFSSCTQLDSVTIPSSVQTIGHNAFDYGILSSKTKLGELHYTGTKAQWDELMNKEISYTFKGQHYMGKIGTINPMLKNPENFDYAHTVSFDCGNQAEETSKVEPKVVQYEGTVTQPPDPKADGYQFKGWYTQKNGGELFNFDQKITADVTVYAHWSEVKPDHTVYFDCGGKAEGTSKVVEYEGIVTPPADPIAKGHQFDGWYTKENGGVPFDFNQKITKDVTVYAHWSVKPTPTPDPEPNPNPNPNPNPDPNPNPNPKPNPDPEPKPNPTPTPTPDTDTVKKYTLTEKDGTLVCVTVEKNGTIVDITKNVVLEQQGTTQIGKIPAGAMVTVTANAAPEGMVFAQWNISDPALMGDPDVAHTSQTMTFPMPAADVTVEAMYESAENARETELLGSAALIGAVGISAVVLAYQAHQLGTELYLKYLLPSGAAIPQNRIQLAELLWRNAGEPVPDVNAMYEDIGLNEEAAQQAAQWALENELMELPDEEHTEQFKPDEQISYGEAIRAWKKAQQLKTAE